jgi:hypothetical protein
LLELKSRGDPVFFVPREEFTFMLDDIVRAIALMLVFEGILPFVAPNRWREMAKVLSTIDEGSMRSIGLFSMVGGLLLLFIFR